MRSASLALLALLAALAGCPPRPPAAPADRREALARVNDNLARLDRPVQCNALVSFRFEDAERRTRRFIGHEARLFFESPRCLRLDVRSLAGVVAQFGSNDRIYWIWVEPEVRKLWWGEWAGSAGGGAASRLAIPPGDLLDVLMIRPLPETLAGGLLPLLRVVGDDQRLLFVRVGPAGQPAGLREVRLDPYPPHQPVEIVDRLPDGQTVMRARLRDHRRIGRDGPFTARRYVVEWPGQAAELRLDILSARFRDDLPADVFDFDPAAWDGESERVDRPATAAAGRPAGAVRP